MSSSSLVDPADMTKLARALVNPDKSVRDKTCFNLTAFFSVTSSFTDMEMLKLWKALYYCMWLSDKNEIQTELAAFLCSVVDDFPNVEISTLYIRMFFRTMLREWPLLDQHRLNKFYRLLRFMMRKIFMLLSNHKFDLKLTKSILEVLHDEVLNKVPNGVRFHLFDVFLEELYLATDGDISTSILIVLVTPLLNLLAVSRDASCQDRISKVFTSYLSTFAVENKVSLKINSSSENGTSTGMAPSLFSKVDTKALQALVFSMASDTTTLDTNRSKLYGLHKQFAAKTGMAFVEESVLLKYTALENSDDQLVEQKSMSESNKKNSDKKRPLDTHASKETNNSEPTESTTDPTSALKKKKRKSATDDSISSTIPVVAVAANNSDLTTKSTINSKNVIAKSTSKVNGPSYHSASASHSVIVDHSVDQADFIASKKFEGAKLGYAFKKVCLHICLFYLFTF